MMRFSYPRNLSFNCSKCGLCCGDTIQKTRRILLLQSDAERIAKATNQQVRIFAAQSHETAPYVFEMRKDTEGKCLFLKNSQCTIYEQRPLICRFYPFELTTEEDDSHTFTATEECPAISKIREAKKLDEGFFLALLKLAAVELNGAST